MRRIDASKQLCVRRSNVEGRVQTLGLIGTFDDFDVDLRGNFRQSGTKLRSLIAAIDKDLLQKWKHAEQGFEDEHAAVAILNIGRMHDGVEQQSLHIYEKMALLALDFLAGVIPRRINADPLFSALFTL